MLKFRIPYSFMLVLLMLLLLMLGYQCKKDTGECPKCPVVFEVTPSQGLKYDTVLIKGKYLLPDYDFDDTLQIRFNGKLIPDEYILSNYKDSIRMIIPEGTQSGPVTVDLNKRDGLVSNGYAIFNYIPYIYVSTFAGSGFRGNVDNYIPTDAKFYNPGPVAVDPLTGDVYVVQPKDGNTNNTLIRRISTAEGVKTILESTEKITAIAVDYGGQVYCAVKTSSDCRIKLLSFSGSAFSLINFSGGTCGHANGSLSNARYQEITGLAADFNNNVYVSENYYVRKIQISGIPLPNVTTVAGTGSAGFANGSASTSMFNRITGIAVGISGAVFLSDEQNNRIRVIDPTLSTVSTVAGTGSFGFSNGISIQSDLSKPQSVTLDVDGNIFILEENNCVRFINAATNYLSVLAGYFDGSVAGSTDGFPGVARFDNPEYLTYDLNRKVIYISDTYNHKIRSIKID